MTAVRRAWCRAEKRYSDAIMLLVDAEQAARKSPLPSSDSSLISSTCSSLPLVFGCSEEAC